MLSLARSRYTLLVQFVFLAANAVGVLFAIIYNAQTPDLYPNNAHHKIGWIITAVVSAQTFISLVGRAAGAFHSHRKGHIRGGSDVSTSSERHAFIPATCEENGSHYFSGGYCLPHDSGQGSEPNTESLRGSSVDGESLPMPSPRKEYAGDDDDAFEDLPLSTLAPKSAWVSRAAKVVSSRVWKYLAITYKVIDRIILPFGFVAFATGVITCGRFFVSSPSR